MIKFIITIYLLTFSFSGLAQNYKPTDEGSKIHFKLKNFGIDTGGELSGLTGDISFTPANNPLNSFNVSVDVNTIDTDNEKRDKHLKETNYFDVEKYPQIIIKSKRISRTNKSSAGWFHFTGTLTMHGVTKPLSFPFKATKKGSDYLFVGGFTINRMDFGIGKISSVMSNSVKVSLSILAKKS